MLRAIQTHQSSPQLVRLFLYTAIFTLFIQAVHMVEHFTQVIQKFALHVPAHGLIGQLDLEPVHFWFNVCYLLFFVFTFAGWLLCRNDVSKCTTYWNTFTAVLLVGLLLQTWHMTEHSVKLAQFLRTGVQGTPGILGAYFDGVLLHFVYNSLVFLPLAFVFFAAKLYLLPRGQNTA